MELVCLIKLRVLGSIFAKELSLFNLFFLQ